MQNKYRHRIQDALRLTNSLSVEATVQNIKRAVLLGAAPFNYKPSETVARFSLMGEISESQVRQRCSTGSKLSVKQNTEASLLLLKGMKPFREVSPISCYDMKEVRFYKIRDDLGFVVRVPFFYTQKGIVHVPWFQFAKTLRYTPYQWSILAYVLTDLYGEEFSPNKCEVVLCDLAAPQGFDDRKFEVHFASTLHRAEKSEVERYFQVYADAYDICVEQGVERVRPVKKPQEERSDKPSDLFEF